MIRFISLLFVLCIGFIRTDSPSKILTSSPKIVLITIDGVRWQDMFDAHQPFYGYRPTSRYLIPTIYKHFVDGGIAIGRDSNALVGGPAHVSLPGYLEIMRGYPSLDCTDNYCAQNTKPTLINEFVNDAAVFAGWEPIAKVFDNSLAVVNIGRRIRNPQWQALGLPETDAATDCFEDSEYKTDPSTMLAALTYLKTQQQPSFLWISLGDTDEWAHLGNMLYYWQDLNAADEFIGKVMKLTEANTVYIICPDHGRSDDFINHHWDPASRRVWIMISGAGIPKVGFVKYSEDVYLSNIYDTIMDLRNGTRSPKSLLNYSK